MKNGLRIKAVIFDIDGTLSPENSWHVLAINTGGTAEEDLHIYNAQKNGELSSEEADRRILEMWKRNGSLNKTRFVEILEPIPLREDALGLINYLKDKHIAVCLITGAMKLYAEIVAKKLGVDHYYGNAKLNWDENYNIIGFSYEIDQANLKLNQFREFCQKNNYKPEDCVAIGDSENDSLLFLETKKGIAIRTEFEDKVLEAAAWKVVNNLSEIKQLI